MDSQMTFSLGHKVEITFMPVEPGTFVMGDEEEFNEYGWADKLMADDARLWKELIRTYNYEVFGEYTSEDGIPEDLPIPDYTRLPDKVER